MGDEKKEARPYKVSAKDWFDYTKNRNQIRSILSLDIGLGGGIPYGSTCIIGGMPKIGKTTIALQYAANGQNQYGSKVFYFPVENRVTYKVMSQVRGLLLDEDHFEFVFPPQIKNKKGEVIGNEKWPSETWWEVIGQTITDHPRSILIIDSISQLSSEKEISESIGYQDRGAGKKIESQFSRRFGDLILPNQVVVFMIAQIQSNTSGYGAATQMKIGNSFKHQADVTLFGKRIEKWDEKDGKILGHDMVVEVQESPNGSPYTTINIPLRYGYGVDDIKDVMTHAINWNIIVKGGSWFSLPFVEVTIDEKKDKNKEKTSKFLYVELNEEGKPKDTKYTEKDLIRMQGENGIRQWLMLHPEETKFLEDLVRKIVFG